jgi:hypothetical protein
VLRLLQHGDDVAGRVPEPGDVRALATAEAAHDALLVLDLTVVLLELDAARGELRDGLVDVVDREVEDRVRTSGASCRVSR